MGNLNSRLLVNTRQGYPETQLLINPTPHNAKDNIPLDLCVCKQACQKLYFDCRWTAIYMYRILHNNSSWVIKNSCEV